MPTQIHISFTTDELELLDRVASTVEGPGHPRKRAVLWALRAAGQGASPVTLGTLDEQTRRLRETLRGIAALDLVPHPCPPQVDARWWRDNQASLHQRTLDQLVVAIERADQQAAAIVETIASAKKGGAQ